MSVLRFGVVPLEFKPSIDRIVVDGIPDFSRFDIVEVVREAVEKGYEMIEITLDIEYIIPGALTPDIVTKLAELKDDLGHSYTAHLPLWSTEPSSFNNYIRSASVESTVSSINLVNPLEPEIYVYHATGALGAEFSNLNYPANLVHLVCGYMASFAATSIEEILTRSELDPRHLAIENIEFPFDFTRDLVDEYDTSICFDTGHLLTRYSGDEPIVEFYQEHKDRITELHLHDGSYSEIEGVPVHSDHIALGEGEMPIRDFLMELVKDNFNGPIILELTLEEADQSLQIIRELVPEALQ